LWVGLWVWLWVLLYSSSATSPANAPSSDKENGTTGAVGDAYRKGSLARPSTAVATGNNARAKRWVVDGG